MVAVVGRYRQISWCCVDEGVSADCGGPRIEKVWRFSLVAEELEGPFGGFAGTHSLKNVCDPSPSPSRPPQKMQDCTQ